MSARRCAAAALTALLLAGCAAGNELHDVDAERLADWEAAMSRTPSEWPLNVPTAQIDCLGGDALAMVVDGQSYWLNGLGKDLAGKFDLSDPDPIWLDDPDVEGLKIPMGGLTAYGLAVC